MKRKGALGRGRTKEAREIERAVIAAGGTVERTTLRTIANKAGLTLEI